MAIASRLGLQRSAAAPFHLMAKPSGPQCNLDCTYCFYLEKEALFAERKQARRMSAEALEAYVRQTIAATPRQAPVQFTWQGGEPALLGIDFYRQAVALQKRHGAGRAIENSFQTNGTLIDAEWARFFAEQGFLVGLSLDGPASVHDRYRRYANGKPSHAQVMAALRHLQAAGVAYNVLACVDAHSSQAPLEVYRFLRDEAQVEFVQFTPVVERVAGAQAAAQGLALNGPGAAADAAVAPFSVAPAAWGQFLNAVFDEWRQHDVGRVFVMNFEWTLAAHLGAPGVVCHHQPVCGRALVAEHNGDVYACDHFVYPEYKLGNLASDSLVAMVDGARAQAFGKAKYETLPGQCRACPHLGACWGGCPKHRFATTAAGEPGLNYLCEGFTLYLSHTAPVIARLGAAIRAGRDPASAAAAG
ncbi:MAG TPA: anaerobic sulfatase maturase [Novosphingobium sp.]|nr:anaerobic sulfatase maturase [Novosphingobium sp.]HZV09008.1 anaerobic sulfatase maturase [Novosphingobium sp.]